MRGIDVQSLKYNCVATVAAWWCISHGMQREFCPSILYYRLRYKCKLGAVCLHISTGECKRLHAEQQVVIIYVSLRLRVQNAVPAQPCVAQLEISLVLLNFLHCNFR